MSEPWCRDKRYCWPRVAQLAASLGVRPYDGRGKYTDVILCTDEQGVVYDVVAVVDAMRARNRRPKMTSLFGFGPPTPPEEGGWGIF